LAGCAPQAAQTPQGAGAGASDPQNGAVTITFDFQKQDGHGSNQFAVWVDDESGSYIKTLYATWFVATGGYKSRPDSVPVWVRRSGVANMANMDAVTSATPSGGPCAYTWDLTDGEGSLVKPGKYKFFVEGTLRWKNHVLYTGEIEVGGATEQTADAETEFTYSANDESPALTESSPESKMIGAVTATYTPPAG
jgi:hypothetical protein